MLKELQEIGMDDKESRIYQALIILGKGSINDLLKKTIIERRTIYDVLERLIQKGYASSYVENRTRVFIPTNPKLLLEEIDNKRDAFFKILPRLENLGKNQDNAYLELLKGRNGIKTIFLEIQNSGSMHYAFGNISHFLETLDLDTRKFLKNIEAKKFKEKIIYPKGSKIVKIKGGQYRILDQDKLPPTPVIIFNDVVCLFIFSEPVQIIKITSKEVADSYLRYFNLYWSMAKDI